MISLHSFLSSGWQTCKPVVARDLVNGGTAASGGGMERSGRFAGLTAPKARQATYKLQDLGGNRTFFPALDGVGKFLQAVA